MKKKRNLIIIDCIEKLCEKLKKHAMKIINYEKKEMIPITKEENKCYKNQEACHISEEKFCVDKDDKNYTNKKKVKDHCQYTGKFREDAHTNAADIIKFQKIFQ